MLKNKGKPVNMLSAHTSSIGGPPQKITTQPGQELCYTQAFGRTCLRKNSLFSSIDHPFNVSEICEDFKCNL